METTTIAGKEERTVNRLVMKAVLLDMITFVKFRRHMAPNWQSGKETICIALGLSLKANPKTVIKAIGQCYADNGLKESEYDRVLANFGITEEMLKV
jgi:hypothetical protein